MNQTHIVETSSGKLRGSLQQGVYSFKGIPYGADTGGANRFKSAKPFVWTGVRDALAFGPRAPQFEPPSCSPLHTWVRDPAPTAENCLVLNVFTSTLEQSARRPVLIYLHGGGFVVGAGGAPGLDGRNMARRDVVVLTLNHRLNLFGFLQLGDIDGGRYAEASNAGMLDLVAALEWVRVNIDRFGGDPANVTIFGQSGGGSKVAVLMAMPRARGLFHKAIIQSASSLLRLATLEEAERNTDFFLRTLGLKHSQVRHLLNFPAEILLKAQAAAVQAAGQVDNCRPVVDGHVVPSQPFDAAAVRLSAHVPLIAGWCENEQRLEFAANPGVFQCSAQEAVAATAHALDISDPEAKVLLAEYAIGRPRDKPGDLYAQAFGDHRFRRSVTGAAERQIAWGGAPVYVYLLSWKTPVQNGLLRAPHTLCIPFAFGNVDLATGITGSGGDRYRLQDEVSGAWLAFARTGDPNHAKLPHWPRYDIVERPTLVFDVQTRLVPDPWRAERIALEPFARYEPAVHEGRLLASRMR
ncbi:carboxylesterase/lipase family protein [Variovorax paradoxus]|nr:carboxylesterase/lipase family protein [Variovorax paradoxus]